MSMEEKLYHRFKKDLFKEIKYICDNEPYSKAKIHIKELTGQFINEEYFSYILNGLSRSQERFSHPVLYYIESKNSSFAEKLDKSIRETFEKEMSAFIFNNYKKQLK